MIIQKFKRQVPAPLRTFLIRGILLLIAWELAYSLFLKPEHTIDAFLTHIVGASTTWALGIISPELQPSMEYFKTDILITILKGGQRVVAISIADACNALELTVLYVGFILSVPLPLKKSIHFIYAGILFIYLVNTVRCLSLIYVHLKYPHLFAFAHHYLFTLIIYLIIFLIWVRYIKIWIKYENA